MDHMVAVGAAKTVVPEASTACRPPAAVELRVRPVVLVLNWMFASAGLAAAVALVTISCSV